VLEFLLLFGRRFTFFDLFRMEIGRYRKHIGPRRSKTEGRRKDELSDTTQQGTFRGWVAGRWRRPK